MYVEIRINSPEMMRSFLLSQLFHCLWCLRGFYPIKTKSNCEIWLQPYLIGREDLFSLVRRFQRGRRNQSALYQKIANKIRSGKNCTSPKPSFDLKNSDLNSDLTGYFMTFMKNRACLWLRHFWIKVEMNFPALFSSRLHWPSSLRRWFLWVTLKLRDISLLQKKTAKVRWSW